MPRNHIMNLPHLKPLRKELRKNLTPAEATLWKLLKGKQLEGKKFRRQHSIENYIVDFYCPEAKLVVELDGQGHYNHPKMYMDEERDARLAGFGITVLRFENKLVFDCPDYVLEEIRKHL